MGRLVFSKYLFLNSLCTCRNTTANLQKINKKYKKEKVGVAVLYSTRYENPKGTRIGPPLFIHQNYKTNLRNYLDFLIRKYF